MPHSPENVNVVNNWTLMTMLFSQWCIACACWDKTGLGQNPFSDSVQRFALRFCATARAPCLCQNILMCIYHENVLGYYLARLLSVTFYPST